MDFPIILLASPIAMTGGMEQEIPRLIQAAGPVAKGILILVGVLSVYSWAVIFQKFRAFAQAKRAFREADLLVRQLSGLGDAGLVHARLRGTPWGAMLGAAYAETFGRNLPGETHTTSGGESPSDVLERVERAMTRAAMDERDRYERGILGIATVANVSPFLGLFGTVWGVMNAFLSMGLKGSANLAAVGPGIAEALVTTVAGLAAAIPASMAYNQFVGKIRALEADMDRFSASVLDRVRYGEATAGEKKRVPVTL